MALAPEQIDNIVGILSATAAGQNPVPAIRQAWPGMMVSRCDALDMRGETVFRNLDTFQLFLVDASDHCWRIVDQPEQATGVVVAAKD